LKFDLTPKKKKKNDLLPNCCGLIVDLFNVGPVSNKSATSWRLPGPRGELRRNVCNGFWAQPDRAIFVAVVRGQFRSSVWVKNVN